MFACTLSLESFPVHTPIVRMCTAFWQRSTPSSLGMMSSITSVCDVRRVIRRASSVILT